MVLRGRQKQIYEWLKTVQPKSVFDIAVRFDTTPDCIRHYVLKLQAKGLTEVCGSEGRRLLWKAI